MEFNWLTFGFEIVNFLVLVWLLHRLLYRPVLAMIQRRRDEIAAAARAAEAQQAEAEQRKVEYDRRLEDWAGERTKARRELDEELERERQRRLQALEAELADRRRREEALASRQAEQAREAAERAALTLAGRFAARLLGAAAGPELQARLVRLLVDDLAALPAERRAALREALASAAAPLQVTSAYPLDDAQRAELAQALAALTGGSAPAMTLCRGSRAAGRGAVAGRRLATGRQPAGRAAGVYRAGADRWLRTLPWPRPWPAPAPGWRTTGPACGHASWGWCSRWATASPGWRACRRRPWTSCCASRRAVWGRSFSSATRAWAPCCCTRPADSLPALGPPWAAACWTCRLAMACSAGWWTRWAGRLTATRRRRPTSAGRWNRRRRR